MSSLMGTPASPPPGLRNRLAGRTWRHIRVSPENQGRSRWRILGLSVGGGWCGGCLSPAPCCARLAGEVPEGGARALVGRQSQTPPRPLAPVLEGVPRPPSVGQAGEMAEGGRGGACPGPSPKFQKPEVMQRGGLADKRGHHPRVDLSAKNPDVRRHLPETRVAPHPIPLQFRDHPGLQTLPGRGREGEP